LRTDCLDALLLLGDDPCSRKFGESVYEVQKPTDTPATHFLSTPIIPPNSPANHPVVACLYLCSIPLQLLCSEFDLTTYIPLPRRWLPLHIALSHPASARILSTQSCNPLA